MDKISVCIATYNGEKYIKKQLLSILPQLSENDEVIISDDNSTDSTLLIISQINDSRISVSVNKERSGPIGNFEQALKRATGNYIYLSDQDDIWEADKVKITQSLLKDHDLILSDCRVVNENNLVLHESFFNLRGSRKGFWHNLYKNSYVGCCMAFRKEILTYVLPFPRHIHMHDWWIGLLVEVKGKVYFYSSPLIKYVRHGNNASPTGEKGYGLTKQVSNRFFMLLNVVKRLRM
ncbi:glycosyltransferase family 2 protein [Spirosoma soli]|uniref:Glycosyltransferase family 2 protein n=1 Tax=Spirosoma soli TaxID=1770529 RepID=A0ABW5M2I8_9BACT